MKKSAMAVLVFMVVFVSHLVFAGDIDSPGPPSEGSKMPSLLNIYDYLNLGTLWTDPGSFQEPAAGPGSTMKTTKEIYDDSKTKFDQCDAEASDVATDKKFFSTQPGNWGVKTGTGLISTGDAVVAEVLAPKTFSNSDSANLTGTMTNVGQQTITPTTTNQAITQGYHAGTGYAEGDGDLVTGNIKSGVTIFDVAGKAEVVDTTEATNPVVAVRMKTGDVGFVNGNKVTGTGTKTLSVDNDTVAEGYYAATTLSGVDGDLTEANIVSGTTIFGKAGSAVAATGNAVEADVLAPKTFSKSGSAGLTGTMTNNAAVTYTPTTADQVVAAGYHNGSGKVEGDADLTEANIKKDVDIFGKVGTYPLAGVEKTGQTPTVPFAAPTGSDGDLQKGVAWPNPRFTNNGDGTVTDNLTGLMWAQNANADGAKTWSAALTYCNNLSLGPGGSEYTDWRLPNVKELSSLIDWAYYNPALSNDAGTAQWTSGAGSSFSGVQSPNYWSSTTSADVTDYAWRVVLCYGSVSFNDKTSSYYVWPVRGGQ